MEPDTGYWLPIQRDGLGQHRGVDFDCPKGTIVRAIADGVIFSVKHESSLDFKMGSGLRILQLVNMLGHDSWIIKYSHLKAAYVIVGQMVKRFEPMAESGDSGNADHPFLHVDMMDLKQQYRAIQFEP